MQKRLSRRGRLSLLTGLLLAAACMGGGQAPSAGKPLVLGVESRAPSPEEGPFRVVFAGPRGEAAAQGEISVVFSRPLRALETDAPPPEISIRPALSGKWLWVGGRALRFVPEDAGGLPGATEFDVEVPAGLGATDGSKLSEPYRFSFTTPRPKLVRSSPGDGSEGLLPDSKLELYFNQGVDPAALERHGKLSAEAGGRSKSLAFRAVRRDPAQPKRVEIVPAAPLPIASTIRFTIDDELTGLEGKLPSGQPQSVSVETYGPLRVERLECHDDRARSRGCRPGSSIALEFSNDVKVADLRRAVSVSPALPLRWPSWQSAEDSSRWFSLEGRFAPATSYTIRVAGTLRDEHGQALGGNFARTVRYGDHDAELAVGIEGEALEPSRARPIPLGYRNVTDFELVTARLEPGTLTRLTYQPPNDFLAELRRAPGASSNRVRSAAARNEIGRSEIDPLAVLGGKRGVFGLATSYRDPDRRRDSVESRLVKLSDLALTAKLSRHGSLVWVTRLSTGSPVSGAEITLLGGSGKTIGYQSDASGLARIPAADFAPDLSSYREGAGRSSLLVARSGDDWTFERVSDHLPEWRVPVPIELSGELRSYGLLFTERGVYRPGDEVAVKGIVRDETATGNSTPKNRAYELKLHSSSDEVVASTTVRTSEFGGFSARLKVPAAGELGTYRISAKTSERSGEVLAYFDVAEYRPAEFEVAAQAEKREVVRGADPGFSVRGDYLYGAPMAKAKVTYAFAREQTSVTLPGHEGFVTDARVFYSDLSEEPLRAGVLRDGSGELASDGSLKVAQRLDLPDQRYPERVSLSAEVTDETRQAVAAQTSVLVHPADFYVALAQPADYFVEAPAVYSPEVLALSPKGERLAGKRVELELVRRRWTYSRQDLGGAESRAVSRPLDRVVSRCSVTTAATPTRCGLKLDEAGYYLVRARSTDEKRRAVEAALGLYGLGKGEIGWGDNDRAELEIVPNKKLYRVGETAKFLVKSPFKEAEALITVERAGVYRAERRKLSGPTPTLHVPVTQELAPNAFVAVHLIVPRGGGKVAPLGPSYRYGYAELPVDPEARRLTVAVKPLRAELLPGQRAEVELEVKDRSGQGARSELAVYAVDEGVLSLTGYRTPDPVPVFGAARPLSVATLETREGLAKIALGAFDALGEDKGSDGGGGGLGAARSDFRQVAFFDPRVVTDARGRAKVRFELPDSLTTYRVMAVAVSADDRYGFGDSRITASKPLMVRPALPRFLRAGDALEASAVIAAKGIAPGPVSVRAEVRGGRLEGPAEQRIELGKDGSKEVRFKLRTDRVGPLEIAFSASAAGARDSVSLSRRVTSPATLETVAVYGDTKGSVLSPLGDFSKLRPDVGSVRVSLASSSLVGVDTGLEDLSEYPYGCTEQLTSRLLPLGPLVELGRAFDFPQPRNAALVRDRLIGEIVARQRGDGGFGMWPESPESSAWVTPYALWVLDQTRRGGAPVPKTVFTRGREFLRRWLSREAERDLPAAAFAVDVLAALGAPDPGYADKLWQRRAELPAFSQALLLHALAVGKSPVAMRDALARELENALSISANQARYVENLGDEYAELMDSPTRTTAMVLRALLAVDPDHPLATRLARGLLDARVQGRWRSTQETAFTLLALDDYRRAQEREQPDFQAKALLGQRVVASLSAQRKGLHQENGEVPLAEVVASGQRGLLFEKEGGGTLFYELSLEYAPSSLPSSALDAGFFVRKTLRAVTPSALASALEIVPEAGATRFAAGDLVLADLVVVAPSPSSYVVIDDPLPAGFEAVDASLRTTAAWLGVPSSGGDVSPDCPGCDPDAEAALAEGRAYLSVWHRRELRDDRALFFVDRMPAGMYHFRYVARATSLGSFLVPPTKAFEMYAPETYGRTAAALVEVR